MSQADEFTAEMARAVTGLDGARALLVLLGIAMLAEGILNLCVACSMIKIIRHQQPDVLDAEFYEKRG